MNLKKKITKKKIFVVAGGVAANKRIRSMLTNLCNEEDYKAYFHLLNFVVIMLQ